MNPVNNNYLKFPSVLKQKLQTGEISFPEQTLFNYNDITAYRCVARHSSDESPVMAKDFMSQFEEKRVPKRGQDNYLLDPCYYGVSLYTAKDALENVMRLPRPTKKIFMGKVHDKGGPQLTKDKHICWWLYKDADLSSFTFDEEKNND